MTEPLKLEERLLKKLKRSHVRVDAPDGDTIFLRNVPPSGGCFNKSHTNLLIKRARTGLPFLICVDEDLEYTGADRSLRRAFTAAHKQQGWRVLCMEQDARADLQRVVERALDLLGFDRREPVLDEQQDAPEKGAARDGLLSSFGTEISEMSAAGALYSAGP